MTYQKMFLVRHDRVVHEKEKTGGFVHALVGIDAYSKKLSWKTNDLCASRSLLWVISLSFFVGVLSHPFLFCSGGR